MPRSIIPNAVPSTTISRPGPTIVYTFSGPLSTSTSPSITPRDNLSLSGLSVTLATAGSSTTQIDLLVNGNVALSVSLAATATYGRGSLVAPVAVKGGVDTYAVRTTAAGTGAANLGGEIELN